MGTYRGISQCGAGRGIWAAGNGSILLTGGFAPTGNKASLTFTVSQNFYTEIFFFSGQDVSVEL